MEFKNPFEKKARSNVTVVTARLLKELNIPVTTTTIIDSLEQHPNYPSLYCISDSLKKWKVDHIALKVETGSLEKLPTPFIAHQRSRGGNFVVVNNVENIVEYFDGNGKVRKISKEEFGKDWDNTVLLAEKSEQAGENHYKANKRRELLNNIRIPIVLLASILLISLYAIVSVSFMFTILIILKFTGCIIAGLLFMLEIDKENPLAKQLCATGKKTNCKAILSSKQARIFNLVSWTELGFFYFVGSFLYLLSGPGSSTSPVISLLSLATLPYIVFSVFYQWRIARQWCVLCLIVQSIFALEIVVSYFVFWNTSPSPVITADQLLPFFTAFFIPFLFLVVTKKVFLAAHRGKIRRKEFNNLKYNKEVFQALLQNQNNAPRDSDDLGITLGNLNAKNTVIKVCSPYCGPCSKAHTEIEELLDLNPDLKVKIIFTATNNESDIMVHPVRHLLALYEKNEPQLIKRALADWYTSGRKDYKAFSLKYSLNGELKKQGEKIERMDKWCKEAGITHTPTFFVNNFQLPRLYSAEALKHLL